MYIDDERMHTGKGKEKGIRRAFTLFQNQASNTTPLSRR